ncbi:hypothetical protein PF010_g145 [Phytophthora fragariae]|nr:hypothetical protein PF003_g20164 [Phytophthora fragariae]KAE9044403.1 hypothetical protein PR001_g5376 [Phytophthora rubi]KAE9140534.1 hypothetical protein PF010_g145 [Phytophthora fragariae]
MPAVTESEHGEVVPAQENDKSESEIEKIGILNEDNRAPPISEEEQAQTDEEQDEAYDGDNFDDDGLPSARATESDEQPQVNDKHEVSGYGSEFEEDPGGNTLNIVHTNPTDNQDEGDDEDEYSHDDFVD